ncbi:MAG: MFS transporter [Gaiellaceae bacterium]
MTGALNTLNRRTFASLRRHRNYRLFFWGQAVSLVGSWMQTVAAAWLIIQMTHSGLAIGWLAVAQFLPFTLFGLFAGALVDRFDARRLVISTQALQMVLAALLAGGAFGGFISPWFIDLAIFLRGSVMVVDAPARQALVYYMVGRDELPNAIALNSSLFNASRVIGPAVGGLLVALVGASWCFALNAASFLAVLAGLLAMRVEELVPLEGPRRRVRMLAGTREGLAYARHSRSTALVLVFVLFVSTFAFNFNVLLPLLASVTLHSGANTLGILWAAFGGGALVGALLVAALGRASLRVLLLATAGFGLSQLALAVTRSMPVDSLLLFLGGGCFTVWSASATTILQLRAPDRLRGRVLGLYYYAFNGVAALGGLLAGWLFTVGGSSLAFAQAGLISLLAVVAAQSLRERSRDRASPRASTA